MSASDSLTTTKVARLLGVSVATLHNWKDSGKFVPEGVSARGYNSYTCRQVQQFKSAQAQALGTEIPEEVAIDAAAAAKSLGIRVTQLRSLDRAGRFIPAARSASNRRMYTERQVEEIREYLAAGKMPPRIAALTITRPAAAEIIGVGIRTLQRWEQEKKLVPLARWETQSLYSKAQVLKHKERWLAETEGTRHISR